MKRFTTADYHFYEEPSYNNCVAVAKFIEPEINGLGVTIYWGSKAVSVLSGNTRCEAGVLTSMFLNAHCIPCNVGVVREKHPKLITHLRRLHKKIASKYAVVKALVPDTEEKMFAKAYQMVMQELAEKDC